jgi:ABC-type Fe3+/spermidine/putrescine transport system ATPase subunit
LPIERGRVELGGRVVEDTDAGVRLSPQERSVGVVFQQHLLFPHLSALENVAFGLRARGVAKPEARARAQDWLESVGLGEHAAAKPGALSGGQAQRVALARALAADPAVLLLDEPLSALDKKVRLEMQLELKRLQHEVGITFVVVTHDQEEAMSMADRIAVLRDGQVEQIDAPVDLYEHPATMFVARFIGSNNLFSGTAAPGGLAVGGQGLLPAATEGSSIPAATEATEGLLPAATEGSSIPAGSPAYLAIRPEHVRISEDDGVLHGTVIDTLFYGGVSTISVAVPGLESPVLVTQQGPTRITRDAPVRLRWDPERAVLLPGS